MTETGEGLSWMAWTFPTALFFAAIAILGAGRATDAERALRAGATAAEAAARAADLVEGDHPRALVAELTRRALVEAGRP